MNLTSKLGKGLRTGILATTLTGLIGCAAFEEAFKETEGTLLEQVIWQGAAAKLREKGEFEKAQAMENIGFIRGNIEAAKAGRSEVNVNVDTNRGNNSRVRKEQSTNYVTRSMAEEYFNKYVLPPENVVLTHEGMWRPVQGYGWVNKDDPSLGVEKEQNIIPSFFVANYWKDLDEDGNPQTDEIVGYNDGNKRDFKMSENIMLWADIFTWTEPKSLRLEILNPSGETVYSNVAENTRKGVSYQFPSKSGFPSNFFLDKGGSGTYMAFYSIDGKLHETLQFNIE